MTSQTRIQPSPANRGERENNMSAKILPNGREALERVGDNVWWATLGYHNTKEFSNVPVVLIRSSNPSDFHNFENLADFHTDEFFHEVKNRKVKIADYGNKNVITVVYE